jgi:hypothetical protein
MRIATVKPKPWQPKPATRIGIRAATGCEAPMTEAMVPESMTGKIGRSHDGMKLVSLYVWTQKRNEYWNEAKQKAKKV